MFLKRVEKIRKKISRDFKLENPKNRADATHRTETFSSPIREGVAVYQQCYEVAVRLSLYLTHHHEAVQPVA